MNNTLNVAKLEFSLIKPYIKVISFTMLLPIAFVAINRSLQTGVSFAMCLIAMTTGYTFSVAEKKQHGTSVRNVTCEEEELVIGRYLLILAQGAFALVISLITQPFVLRTVGENRSNV